MISKTLSASSLKAGIKRHAAVHENARAVDVIGIVAGEPHGGATDVVRLADAFVGNELHQFAIGFGRAPGFHVDGRADHTGTNRVHADAMRCDFLRDALHHQHNPALARSVVDVTGPRNDFVNAAHANDFPGGATDLL